MASVSTPVTTARRLEGKVALITGGAGVTGKAIAKLFVQHGAHVVISDIEDDLGLAVCTEIGGSITYVHCDVTDEADIKRAIDTTIDIHGVLDIMVNNAGIIGIPEIQIIQSEKSNFEKVMAVNVTGSYLGTKHTARVMIPARSGSIISIGSIATVDPCATPVAYACSKHALLGIVKSAAIELGQFGIRVNCVSPYAYASPLAAKNFRMDEKEVDDNMDKHAVLKGVQLKANDVAEAVMYLASDESRYVSGLNLLVDGAFTVANQSHGIFKYAANL